MRMKLAPEDDTSLKTTPGTVVTVGDDVEGKELNDRE